MNFEAICQEALIEYHVVFTELLVAGKVSGFTVAPVGARRGAAMVKQDHRWTVRLGARRATNLSKAKAASTALDWLINGE